MTNYDSFDFLTPQETKQFLHSVTASRDNAIILLLLNTGIFLTTLLDIHESDIDWKKKQLCLSGKRARALPLDDKTFKALRQWQEERPKLEGLPFFLTEKGIPKRLSARTVDHFLRDYGVEAGLQKPVSVQLLRISYVVNLFKQGVALKEASQKLGQTENWLRHYQRAALGVHHEENAIIGRDVILKDIKALLSAGQSVLLTGPLGIGKTHILKQFKQERLVLIENPNPFKEVLEQLCDAFHPDWKEQLGSRPTAQTLIAFLQENARTSPQVIIIDHLNRLKITDAEHVITLMTMYTILGAVDQKTPKLNALWWKFKEIAVPILTKDEIKALIAQSTQDLTISDYTMLENKLLAQANGYPLAIVDMVTTLRHQESIDYEAIQALSHSVGRHYRDWTSILFIIWTGLVMCRFVAMGVHSVEGYLIAGLGTATFGMFRYLLRRRR